MYLSQLIVNMRSKPARRDLADRFELHRTLMRAYPETLPDDERVLFRLEPLPNQAVTAILVQSQDQPHWDRVERLNEQGYLKVSPRLREVQIPNLEAGQPVMFRLLANPTVKREGKRHALYAEADCIDWLARKGEQHGFEVGALDVRINKIGKVYGKGRQQVWHAVQFDGRLIVKDGSAFADALRQGIGSAKAFGFGLLSIPYAG